MKIKRLFTTLLVCATFIVSACDDKTPDKMLAGKPTIILDGKASIILPPGMVRMPEAVINETYPLVEMRPQEAWYMENIQGRITMTFTHMQTSVSQSQISHQTAVLFSPTVSSVTVNGRKMTRIEMSTPVIEGKILSLMQISSLDNRMLVSTFSVPERLKSHYGEVGLASLSTLKH